MAAPAYALIAGRRGLAWLPAALLLGGCQVGYYSHLLRGQYELLARREPIEQLLQREDLSPHLKQQLARALDARRFASRALLLPDNGSYTSYADLGRPYALWNVFATPELSLVPHEWCYPFAGCHAYRGYYELARARAEAARLGEANYDVHVAGVPAYSTVGWFDDPVLNTVLGPGDTIAGTVFHELAHQKVFVTGDTAFNESFATFVEHQGLSEYLRDTPELAEAARQRQSRYYQFAELMLGARRQLAAIYASNAPPEDQRRLKEAAFARLRADYAQLRASWDDDGRYDGWFAGELNNARLLPFGLYHHWVPAFEALFARVGADWTAFYREVDRLARLRPQARLAALEALRGGSAEVQMSRFAMAQHPEPFRGDVGGSQRLRE